MACRISSKMPQQRANEYHMIHRKLKSWLNHLVEKPVAPKVPGQVETLAWESTVLQPL